MQKKPDTRAFWLRKLFKVHALTLFVSLGVYFVFAFLDPGLLSYDLRQKFRALADDTITISATVLGPPAQPVVIATADCDESNGTLSVALDWGDDPNTYTYDIDRDSAPLVSGLATSLYNDTNVTLATTYQYEVTGIGPMGPGSATSVPVSVTTPASCEITAPAPAVTIVSFAGRNIDSYNGTPRVENRRPIFSGTTSMANATILVTIGGSFIAEFSANSNGYWEWRPPYGVTSGSHMFTVTAIDPSDSVRQATASLRFEITRRDGESSDSKKKTTTATGSGIVQAPIDFTLVVENRDGVILQGQDLQAVLKIMDIAKQYDGTSVPIRYSLIDKGGNVVLSVTKQTVLKKGGDIRESFPIPLYIVAEKYSLRAEILFDRMNVSRMVGLSIMELPLFDLGGGIVITYAETVRNLGWITLFLLMLLSLWSFLFIREYGLYVHAIRHITEQHLVKAGFMSKRKGVVR